jgi:hypothetical protein
MSRACLALRATLLSWSLLALAPIAHAHDTTPGVLALEELADGRYLIAWTPPVDARAETADQVAPRFAPHCVREGAFLDCGERGLDGEVVIEGLAGSRMRVVVLIQRIDAAAHEQMATPGSPRVAVEGPTTGLGAWIALGVEHVLSGLDHLAFLLGLLLVSTIDRRLLITITAFTLAHSVTLALAVLDVVHPSSRVVEALIALSVLLVAREALRKAPTSIGRAPWLVATIFGLVHGLGLAGSLREVGLPAGSVVSALFGFNVGVELGQLAFVLAAVLVARLAVAGSRPELTARARTTLVYGIGTAAAYWLLVRTLAMVA